MRKTNKKGFTIIELVIVITVIAILAGVLIPTFASVIKKANTSADSQLEDQLNTILKASALTDGVESVLDVLDVFAEEDMSLDSFAARAKGRSYYYDTEYNAILYVDDKTGTVISPAEYAGETQKDGHLWQLLSMAIANPEKPADFDVEGKTMTATVANAAEYAYVINQYNDAPGMNLELTINGTIDMYGADVMIEETHGSVTITGTNNAVIKNAISNEYAATSIHNAEKKLASYRAGAIIAKATHPVTISNVTFTDLTVRVIDAGNVGLICGEATKEGSLTLENVTIKNSTVVGGRNVAALLGHYQASGVGITVKGALVVNNVSVGTTQGRSAILTMITNATGQAMKITEGATVTVANSTCRMYDAPALLQQKKGAGTAEDKIVDANGSKVDDFAIYSIKYLGDPTVKKAYPHKDDVYVLDRKLAGVGDTWRALMTLEELVAAYK